MRVHWRGQRGQWDGIVGRHIHAHTVSAGPLGSKCWCRSGGSSRLTLRSQWEADFHSETLQCSRFNAAQRRHALGPRSSLRRGKRGGRCSRMGKVGKLCSAKALHEGEGAASVCEANASLTVAAAAKSHGLECQRAHGRLVPWRNKCNRLALWRGSRGVERKQDARVEIQSHGLISANKQWLFAAALIIVLL